MRALLAPLLLLFFRTALLLYFFAPMRKPLGWIMVLVYVVYEIYSAVMGALPQPPRDAPGLQRGAGAGNQQPAQAGQAAPNPPPAAGADNNNRGAQPFGVVGAPRRPRPAGEDGDILGTTLDLIATYNLHTELEALFNPSTPPPPPPTFIQRAGAFVFLFLVTFYPAVWDKRRGLMRTREGVVRTEGRVRRDPAEEDEPQEVAERNGAVAGGEAASPNPEAERQAAADAEARTARAAAKAEIVAKHNLRADWVKEYIERVMEDEWVDDAD